MMQITAKKIPSLDGLRALSILLVLISHCFAYMPPGGSLHNALRAVAENGASGVSVFFVISGFLITILLERERQDTGRISLKSFYGRRIFRIMPAYFVFLGVIAVIVSLGFLAIAPSQFARALTFTMDYAPKRSWYLGHTWSLSIEEQFYLVWPVLMRFCRRRTLIWIAGGVIVLEPLIRVATYVAAPGARQVIIYMAHTRADMISFGCLTALLLNTTMMDRFVGKVVNGRAAVVAAFIVLIPSPVLDYWLKGGYQLLVDYTVQGLCITVIMLYLVLHAQTTAGRFFNSRVPVHLGLISYSLYLWQELFLGGVPQSIGRRMAGVIFALLAAEASYHLVEQPMLRVRGRLARRRRMIQMRIASI